jgi:hypothetical protein
VTLAPADRRLLSDILAPPGDQDCAYRLDEAIGTTYTLDLLALLHVPLAATTLPWMGHDGEPLENPFALLAALRENARRISLYCHAGATRVPARHLQLLTYLEDSVHPVTPPKLGAVFHPKIWLLRFSPEYAGEAVLYRLVVLTRNLTFDSSWDAALTLEGRLLERKRPSQDNAALSKFIAHLPEWARAAGADPPIAARERAKRMSREALRVQWTLPDGFDTIKFHALDGHAPDWVVGDARRLLVVSPFASAEALERIGRDVDEILLISRFDTLAGLATGVTDRLAEVYAFEDAMTTGDGDSGGADLGSAHSLTGLHAKLFIGRRARRTVVWVGSANATEAAFERNVEFVVELEGPSGKLGIDAVRAGLDDAGLLRPFQPGEPIEPDPMAEVARKLERAAHKLATGGLSARVEPEAELWRMSLDCAPEAAITGVSVEARPLSQQLFQRVKPELRPACVFPASEFVAVTPFFALRLTATGVDPRPLEVVVKLPVAGLPAGRAEEITAQMLSDPTLLSRFILILLARGGDVDRFLDQRDDLAGNSRGVAARSASGLDVPLLEPMLRALRREPERLDEVGRLIDDLRRAAGDDQELLPVGLEELWETIRAARAARA